MNTLTPSQVHYIKAIHELASGSEEGVRVCDIAQRLGLTKASASLAISKLEKEKLVRKDGRRQIFLTPEGERHAVLLLDKCEIIRQFLVEVLGVGKETAAADACAIEHVISVDTLCALCRLGSRAKRKRQCGKGCPLPMADRLEK
ncbi:MAG: metal-dependent transcriptional regulator [Peptococcaceae bacterium]|nr:metal-dependent transcriptional regulator [Peptococcaceae bacterium]